MHNSFVVRFDLNSHPLMTLMVDLKKKLTGSEPRLV